MFRRHLIRAFGPRFNGALGPLALLAVAALPAMAQTGTVARPPADTEIVAVEVEVTDLATRTATRYDLGEHVPLEVGDRVHIRLAVTGMVDGAGRRVGVPVEFGIGGGEWRIDVDPAPRGDGIVVEALRPNDDDRGREGRLSHVTFRIVGDYDVRSRLASGGITFDIRGDAPDEVTDDRHEAAESLADDLATILYREPQVESAWVTALEDDGWEAARSLASQLSVQAVRSGTLREAPPWEVAAHLYRNLLGRTGDAAELWRTDQGFRGAIETLQEHGYQRLVDDIVRSAEFRQRAELRELARR